MKTITQTLLLRPLRGRPLGPLVNKKKRYRSDFFKNGFAAALLTIFASLDSNLRFHCMNRILLEPKLDEADPFSQPSGSSACRGDDQVGQTFEPKGADRTSPAQLPPAR